MVSVAGALLVADTHALCLAEAKRGENNDVPRAAQGGSRCGGTFLDTWCPVGGRRSARPTPAHTGFPVAGAVNVIAWALMRVQEELGKAQGHVQRAMARYGRFRDGWRSSGLGAAADFQLWLPRRFSLLEPRAVLLVL
jgi:hypothetical protein